MITQPLSRPACCLALLCLVFSAVLARAADTRYSSTAQERHEMMQEYFADPANDSGLPDNIKEWWSDKFFLGDGYYRKDLADNGVTLSMKFVTDSLGNVSGGRDQGFTYTGSLGLDMEASLEKLAGIQEADFYVSAVWRSGNSLSNEYIGNVFQTQQVFGGQNLRLYAFYWRQRFLEDQLEVKLGRIAQGDDFLSRPIYWSYVQNAFDGNPVSIFLNAPNYAYPNSTWGALAKFKSKEQPFYFQGGVYGGAKDPPQNRNSAHGLDWDFDYLNTFFAGQGGWMPELDIGSQKGLPGNYSMGGYVVTGGAPQFNRGGAPEVDEIWGLYWMVDQMVYSNGVNSQGDKTGITPWFVVSIAPEESDNTMPYSYYGGVRFDAVLPGRPDDFFAVGVVYGQFSDDLNRQQATRGVAAQSWESVIELTYRIQVNQWLQIQPDFQYILNPGGANQFSDAVVLGLQAAVNF